MSKFVIYTPNHQDYYVGEVNGKSGWNLDIKEAHFYRILPQAERIAKILVSQMANHSDPYRIFVREVKEKNGQWKVKNEIEIFPDPDREEYFRQHPKMRGRVGITPPSKPDIRPNTYVLYQPAKDDYLADVEGIGDFERTKWGPHPKDAMTFKTAEDAKRKAAALVRVHAYELTICELHQNEDQLWTKPLEDIFPIDASLN